MKMDVSALLRGHHVGDIEWAIARMRQSGMESGPQLGVEMAMWDALGKAVGLPLCRLLGGVIRTRVDFCGCLGLKEPQAAAETARSYIDNWGFRHIKTKAGRDAEEDLRIASAIQKEIGEEAYLRPDANSGYGPDEAEDQMKKMCDIGFRHFEDPCAIDSRGATRCLLPAYAAAKNALLSATRLLAKDLGPHNINVNAICPGMLWTGFWREMAPLLEASDPACAGMEPREIFEKFVQEAIPMKREQTPEDIGNLVAFLSSEEARNISGQTICVDGGAAMS